MMAKQDSPPLTSHQPLKFLSQSAYLVSICVRLPVWLTIASLPTLRPHPTWTFRQTMMARVAYALTDMKYRSGTSTTISLDPGEEGERFEVIRPGPLELYQGPLASKIKPEAVGGTWYPSLPGKNIAFETVVLYVHGGAFVEGDGRSEYCGFAARTLVEQAGADAVFSLQYRLSGWDNGSPFPAAIQDTLTAYLFLLQDLDIPPSNIVLCGDSAGGNLVIALLRYLKEFGVSLDLPLPRCAALFSPWVVPFDHDTRGNSRRATDFLPSSFLRCGAQTYTLGVANPISDPYITPLGHPFDMQVPVFVNAGTCELFYDDIKAWVLEMEQVENNQVEFYSEDGAVHDTLLVGAIVGFEKSAHKTVSAMGNFMRKVAGKV